MLAVIDQSCHNQKTSLTMLWETVISGFACIHFKDINAVIDWLFNRSICSYLIFDCLLGSVGVGRRAFLFFSLLTELNGENSVGSETGQGPRCEMFRWPLIVCMMGALALYYMFYFEHWKLFLKNLKGFWNMTINCSGLGRTPRTTLVNKDRGQFLPTSLLLGVCSHAAPVLSISRTSHEAQLPQQPATHPPTTRHMDCITQLQPMFGS